MSCRALGWCIGIISMLSAVAAPAPALAGHCAPLCRSFAIGDARSLLWGTAWWQGRPDYDLANLVSDTEALLVPSTPVVVRMETIRRASLYASRDRSVAERLLSTLMTRARNAEQAGRPDALAFFDAAYAANTLYQIGAYDDVPEVRDLVPRAKGLVRDGDPYRAREEEPGATSGRRRTAVRCGADREPQARRSSGVPRPCTESARRRTT